MKKFLLIMVLAVMLFSMMFCVVSAEGDEIHVYLDAAKIEFDVPPQIINDRTMVPIRAIFEKMGAVVEWDGDTRTAICTKGDTIVKMTVDCVDMYINDQLIQMDVAPVVIDGRTLTPARYVAEAFGADVQWSQKNNTVVICSKDVYAYADYPDIPDLGRCYNIPVLREQNRDGFKVYTYVYSDKTNEGHHTYLYENSISVLGGYVIDIIDMTEGVMTMKFTKPTEVEASYYVSVSIDADGSTIYVVLIPEETSEETSEEEMVILFSPDGTYIEVLKSEVPVYKADGWYETWQEALGAKYPVSADDSSETGERV